MEKVLFVCHGNICRSPMAEFILKDIVKKYGMENEFLIASAATSTEEIWNGVGNPVYPPAQKELEKYKISCEGKRAVLMSRVDYDKYDYLIGMDDRNIENMKRIAGGDPDQKIKKLLSFAGESGDIADPWYTGDFEKTYEDIVRGCNGFLRKPCNEALLQAVEDGDEELAKLRFWQTTICYQGYRFFTMSGLPFSYTIKRGRNGNLTRELWVDRRENSKSLSWGCLSQAFSSAFHMREANRPKALGDIRGVSYIYPLLWKFGVLRVPEKIEVAMSGEKADKTSDTKSDQ